MKTPRWHAEIHYITDAGINKVPHDFEEIADLHDIVEHGPHWNAIDQIVIKVQRLTGEGPLTVEEALQL